MKRIKINRDKCVGCLTCTTACIVSHDSEDTRSRIAIMACPYGVLKAEHEMNKYIMKCDMCASTKEKTPQCVAKCPMGAITLEEVEE